MAGVTPPRGTRILVTGSNGFIGKNLVSVLKQRDDLTVMQFTRDDSNHLLDASLDTSDLIFHLAGVNRPQEEIEFERQNAEFTSTICDQLLARERAVPIVFASSIQANMDNAYGRSKRRAEEAIKAYAQQSGAPARIYRLKNVFGKWSRPNYNSVVATFCHNIAHDLPISISDPQREVELVYIDDVVHAFLQHVGIPLSGVISSIDVQPAYQIGLGRLGDLVKSFRHSRKSLEFPDFSDELTRKLYATFLSYLEGDDLAYALELKQDERGCLAEFAKSLQFGQLFISRTRPGVTRGNHYHHTKTEKFLVVEGQAVIRFRSILDDRIIEHRVSGQDFRVLDIPPGYTHSIENVGPNEVVTLFWASEVFDPEKPDTTSLIVSS